MPKPLVVLNVVGLTHAMLGPNTPCISAIAEQGFARPMGTVLPAVTCSAQATLLTGTLPREHGIVGNGWYFRDLAEVLFWRQSNHLVQGEKLYEAGRRRDPSYTTAKLFWWYNMYAPVEWSITPRPSYPADGRKVFDSYSQPPELKDELQAALGVFPLLRFWRPGDVQPVAELLRRTEGVEMVLGGGHFSGETGPARLARPTDLAAYGLDHARSGELVAVAAPGAWFTYYFWLDDALAPDYARTV